MDQIKGIIMKKSLVLFTLFVVLGIAFPRIGEAVITDPITKFCTDCKGSEWAEGCKKEKYPKGCCEGKRTECVARCDKDFWPGTNLRSLCGSECRNGKYICEDGVAQTPRGKEPGRIPTTTSPTELAPAPSSRKKPPARVAPK